MKVLKFPLSEIRRNGGSTQDCEVLGHRKVIFGKINIAADFKRQNIIDCYMFYQQQKKASGRGDKAYKLFYHFRGPTPKKI